MSTLYIIGNGFDHFNGLKTNYADFHNFVIQNYPDLENTIENQILKKYGIHAKVPLLNFISHL